MNLLRELDCARYYNAKHLDGHFTDYELWKMVTVNAAVASSEPSTKAAANKAAPAPATGSSGQAPAL